MRDPELFEVMQSRLEYAPNLCGLGDTEDCPPEMIKLMAISAMEHGVLFGLLPAVSDVCLFLNKSATHESSFGTQHKKLARFAALMRDCNRFGLNDAVDQAIYVMESAVHKHCEQFDPYRDDV